MVCASNYFLEQRSTAAQNQIESSSSSGMGEVPKYFQQYLFIWAGLNVSKTGKWFSCFAYMRHMAYGILQDYTIKFI